MSGLLGRRFAASIATVALVVVPRVSEPGWTGPARDGGLTTSVAQTANGSEAPASVAAYWDGIAPSAAVPGLWKCATEQSSTRSGDGAVMAVSWGGRAFTLSYVSQLSDQVLPDGHPTAEAVELSEGGGRNFFTADIGPDRNLNLIVSGVCLVHFQASGPPTGCLPTKSPGQAGVARCCGR